MRLLKSPSGSRGTPRVANRLLRRSRDFAQVEGNGAITLDIAKMALNRLGIDESGLDEMDRRILNTVAHKFDCGPVGIDNLSTTIGEEKDTIEDVFEPYLIMKGFIQRTRQRTYPYTTRKGPHRYQNKFRTSF